MLFHSHDQFTIDEHFADHSTLVVGEKVKQEMKIILLLNHCDRKIHHWKFNWKFPKMFVVIIVPNVNKVVQNITM